MKAFGGSIVHELSASYGTLLHHVLLNKILSKNNKNTRI